MLEYETRETLERHLMAKLRHFAIVVSDIEKAAQFYGSVFDLKRVGRDDMEFGSGIYLSDGTINLALLKYKGERGSGLSNALTFVGAHHFGFQVDDLAEAQKRIEAAGGTFFFDLGDDAEKDNFERKFKDPDGIIFDISQKGWVGAR
jgi:predicted enzyme related to lactoylglutathione lyase